MSTLEILLVVIGSSIVYAFMSGVVWRSFTHEQRWERKSYGTEVCAGPIFAAIFWPVVFPMLTGVRVIARLEQRRVKVPEAKVVQR